MSSIMKFLTDYRRERDLTNVSEPTIPGPVTDDAERIYDTGLVPGTQAIDPAILDDINTVWVDSDNGLDTNLGTQADPKQTITNADSITNPTKKYIAIKGKFVERVFLNDLTSVVSWPGEIAIWHPPDNYDVNIIGAQNTDTIDYQFKSGYGSTFKGTYYMKGTYFKLSSGTRRILPFSDTVNNTLLQVEDGRDINSFTSINPDFFAIEMSHWGWGNKLIGLFANKLDSDDIFLMVSDNSGANFAIDTIPGLPTSTNPFFITNHTPGIAHIQSNSKNKHPNICIVLAKNNANLDNNISFWTYSEAEKWVKIADYTEPDLKINYNDRYDIISKYGVIPAGDKYFIVPNIEQTDFNQPIFMINGDGTIENITKNWGTDILDDGILLKDITYHKNEYFGVAIDQQSAFNRGTFSSIDGKTWTRIAPAYNPNILSFHGMLFQGRWASSNGFDWREIPAVPNNFFEQGPMFAIDGNVCFLAGNINSQFQLLNPEPLCFSFQESLICQESAFIGDPEIPENRHLDNIIIDGKNPESNKIRLGSAIEAQETNICHCLIQNTNGPAIWGFFQPVSETIFKNCGAVLNDYQEYEPRIGKGYTENIYALMPDFIYEFRYNLIINSDQVAINVAVTSEGFLVAAPVKVRFIFRHNTFIDCNDIFKFIHIYERQHRSYIEAYLADQGAYLLTYEVQDNLAYNSGLFAEADMLKYDLVNNLYNGGIRGIPETETRNITGIFPIFIDINNDNYRLQWAGYNPEYSYKDNSLPLIDSPGAFSASDLRDMGTYIRIGQPITVINSRELLLESPPGSQYSIKSLHEATGDGLHSYYSFSEREYNTFLLDYSNEEQGHDRTRVGHAFRQIRNSKTPVWWFPFEVERPPTETEAGREFIKDEDAWFYYRRFFDAYNFWKDGGFISNPIPPGALAINDLAFTDIELYDLSYKSEDIIDAKIVTGGPSAFVQSSSLYYEYLLGKWIVLAAANNKELYGIVSDINLKKETIKISLKSPTGGTLQNSFIRSMSAFWVGQARFLDIDLYKKVCYFSIPPGPGGTIYGKWDGFVLSIPGLYLFDNINDSGIEEGIFYIVAAHFAIINAYMQGGFYNYIELDNNAFNPDNQSITSVHVHFYLEKTNELDDEGAEIYEAVPLDPKNGFYRGMEQSKLQIGAPSIGTIYPDVFQGYKYSSIINSMLVYPDRGTIENKSDNFGAKDIWWSKNAEYLDHPSTKDRVDALTGQRLELTQVKPTREMRHFSLTEISPTATDILKE